MMILSLIPFGFSAAFWFSMVAVPITGAFFFRYRSRIQEVPALGPWLLIGRPTDVRSLSSMIRRLLSLLLQLLIAGCLILALADPFPHATTVNKIAIVIDTSATMQTKEQEGTRFSTAIRSSQEILESLPKATEVFVVASSDHPVLLSSNKLDPRTAQEELHKLATCDTEADLPAALQSLGFLKSDPAARVIVLSDFAGIKSLSSFAATWTGSGGIQLIPVGTDHPDTAITSYWMRPYRDQWRVGANITARGMSGRTVPVRIVSQRRQVTSQNVQLKDGVSHFESLVALPPGAEIEIDVDSQDALDVDDRVVDILPDRRMNLCLVTSGNQPLERALRADPTVAVEIHQENEPLSIPSGSVVILDDIKKHIPFDPNAAGYLILGSYDPLGLTSAIGSTAPGIVTHWRGEHPAVADLDPSSFRFRSIFQIHNRPPATLIPIVSAGDFPVIAELETQGRRNPKLIYWLFDLGNTDLPGRLSFPVLLWNTIDYLAGRADDFGVQLTGHPLSLDAKPHPVVIGPDRKPISLRPIGAHLMLTDTSHRGFYSISDTAGSRNVAINYLSARGTLPLPHDSSSTTSIASDQRTGVLINWRLFVVIVLSLALVEWILFHLRVLRIG